MTPININEIKLEDIDFEKVKETKDKNVLKRYIKLLEDDGAYFVDLLNATKQKLLEVAPKEYYLLYPRVASAEEEDAAFKDLLEWEASVKETDKALRSAKRERIWDEESGVQAPIRGQEAVVARPNVKRGEIADSTNREGPKSEKDKYARDKTKMKDYYRAWESFDVDAMEEEIDKEAEEAEAAKKKHFEDLKEEQEASRITTAVSTSGGAIPDAHRKHMADSEKEKGNEAFYAKDYDEAEAYYSRSINFLPDDPSAWANRALVRLKLDRPKEALQDCEHSLALNPSYMKALHRKGKALFELKRYDDAVRAFQLALTQSPGNTQINGDLMLARRKLRSDEPQSRTVSRSPDAPPSCTFEELDDEPPPRPTAAVPAAGPAQGYTRVQIEEDSDSESDSEGGNGASSGAPAASNRGFTKVVIEEVSGDEDEEDDPPSAPPTRQAPSPASAAQAHPTAAPRALAPAGAASAAKAAAAPATSSSNAGFRKVPIVEDTESEEDEAKPAAKPAAGAFAPPPRVAAPVAEEPPKEEVCFDDMD